MSEDRFACQCPPGRWGVRLPSGDWSSFICGRRATQEDALCDECRQYCNEPIRPGVAYYDGGPSGHPVPIGDVEIFG